MDQHKLTDAMREAQEPVRASVVTMSDAEQILAASLGISVADAGHYLRKAIGKIAYSIGYETMESDGKSVRICATLGMHKLD